MGPRGLAVRQPGAAACHARQLRGRMCGGDRRARGRRDRQDDPPSLGARARRPCARGAAGGRHRDLVERWLQPASRGRRARKGAIHAGSHTCGGRPLRPKEELARRFENAERRGSDRIHYVRGKIVFGAYSRRLLDRIRTQAGRLFYPLAPDYTSMVPACCSPRLQSTWVGRCCVSYNSMRSNGRAKPRTLGTRAASWRAPTLRSSTAFPFPTCTPRTTTSSRMTWCPRQTAARMA